MAVLKVALDVPVPKLFDYAADDATPEDAGYRALVPFGSGQRVGVIMGVAAASELPPERLRPAEGILRDIPKLPADWLDLIRFCGRYYHCPLGEVAGLALPAHLKQRRGPPTARREATYRITDTGRAALAGLRRATRGRRLLECLDREPLSRGAIASLFDRPASLLDAALRDGWIEAVEVPTARAWDGPGVALSAEQTQAVDRIRARFGAYTPFLLFGITGSGKTEVYLELIRDRLAAEQQVLMLVPEIGLTPQLQGRVAARFPHARLASLHSGLSDGERTRGFLDALSGHANIVIGTRLAVFAPLPRLGLIIIDEEHDASFKQQDGVRYSARDLGVYRARQARVPIVLGSATPSLESYHHANTGRYALVTLERRAREATLPRLRCLDTRGMKLFEGMSEDLVAAIAACLARREQALVFLNRRGFAPAIVCPACGWVSRCDHCSANLVVHSADNKLRCHHCGHAEPMPRACPTCGNQDLHAVGRGTQRLEAALRTRFPEARTLRVDRDSVRSPRQWEAMLSAIHEGRADILVGTQMLAKGHDFPRLTLVGVVNADAALFAADFRAPERLFAQLMQVAGRSGRADRPGEVLIQTEFPDHPLFRALLEHDYRRFAAWQLKERSQALFPPFCFQALLQAQSRSAEQALAFLRAAAQLAPPLPVQTQLYDPVPLRLHRRADWERAQMLIESSSRATRQDVLDAWLPRIRGIKAPAGLRWSVDVDPLEP